MNKTEAAQLRDLLEIEIWTQVIAGLSTDPDVKPLRISAGRRLQLMNAEYNCAQLNA